MLHGYPFLDFDIIPSKVFVNVYFCLIFYSIIELVNPRKQELPKIEEEINSELALDEPPMYRVVLHNDDYTTMEFVIHILKTIFHKTEQESEQIMLDVHKRGKGVCGVYTLEIARTKVEQVKTLAKQNKFPLLATYEIDE
jgi:ATP-dependent Clp protease adaptor protein ClpS